MEGKKINRRRNLLQGTLMVNYNSAVLRDFCSREKNRAQRADINSSRFFRILEIKF